MNSANTNAVPAHAGARNSLHLVENPVNKMRTDVGRNRGTNEEAPSSGRVHVRHGITAPA